MPTLDEIPQPLRGRERPPAANPATTLPRPPFTSLIDAKAASQLLGVPHTWLLAQARAGRIPHHRLGHYVRFDPDALKSWLDQTRIEPQAPSRRR